MTQPTTSRIKMKIISRYPFVKLETTNTIAIGTWKKNATEKGLS
jgi:hypothetical protein